MRTKGIHQLNRAFQVFLGLTLILGLLGATALPVYASEPAPDPETAEFEIEFMKEMINHHAAAVVEGALCVKKAIHAELRDMCEQIIVDQTREIREMQSWLWDWYGIRYRPHIMPEDRQMIRHLAMLKGEAFEIEFMEMMIMHHSMAIEMAQTCVAEAYHEELIGLCQNIIVTQSAEIEQMQMWLCEWYGKCEEM